MPGDFRNIYRHHAIQYDRLVAREDQQGNLFAAINEISPLPGLKVVEFGAGTGRVTRQLSVLVERVFAFDIEPAMLSRANAYMQTTGMTNWTVACADNGRMPVASGIADLVIEGWSFGHVAEWFPHNWRARTDEMLGEMDRILKPGGVAILIETMGTGRRQPQAPTAGLAQLYEYWQQKHGYSYRWIRTDYQFATPEEADELMRFFFGDELTEDCLNDATVVVPECTGIWWKHFP